MSNEGKIMFVRALTYHALVPIKMHRLKHANLDETSVAQKTYT